MLWCPSHQMEADDCCCRISRRASARCGTHLGARRAVTRWSHALTPVAIYPTVSFDPNALFLDDGDIPASAGSGAPLDTCLHLVAGQRGAVASSAIARRMTMSPRSDGAQDQVVGVAAQALPQRDKKFVDVLAFAVEHLADPLNIDDLARQAMMSRRTFDRQFRAVTGMS